MTLEEVMEKSRIEFPKAISLKEAEDLLNYLAENLPADIKYHLGQNKSILHGNDEHISQYQGSVNITANIACLKIRQFLIVSDSCELKSHFQDINQFQDTSKFSEMQFQVIPGYNLAEHRPEIVQLWTEVRTVVTEYFKKESA